MQKPIVTIRTVKGQPLRTESGDLVNEVIDVKIQHDTIEWTNYLKNLKNHGFGKVSVLSVKNRVGVNEYADVEKDVFDKISKEVITAFDTVETLTPEQEKIKELEGAIAELRAIKEVSTDEELIAARARYAELAGKEADKRLTLATIKEKIKDLEA